MCDCGCCENPRAWWSILPPPNYDRYCYLWTYSTSSSANDDSEVRQIVRDELKKILADKWEAALDDTMEKYKDAWKELAKK